MDELRTTPGEKVRHFLNRWKQRIRFFIGSRLPDRAIIWRDVGYGKKHLPVCPRCGDYVYYERQCTQCGQHFLPGARTIGDVLSEVMKDGSKF